MSIYGLSKPIFAYCVSKNGESMFFVIFRTTVLFYAFNPGVSKYLSSFEFRDVFVQTVVSLFNGVGVEKANGKFQILT